MKKYMLFAAIAASWPGLLLPGCTGAQYPGKTDATPFSTTGSQGSFSATGCFLSGSIPQSPSITSTKLNTDNTVTLTWNWNQNAANPEDIIIQYSTDSEITWNFLASSYNSAVFGATSYTTPVLKPGKYQFRIGSVPYNLPKTNAYFSFPSISVTIGSTTNFLSINPIPTMYVDESQTISGLASAKPVYAAIVLTTLYAKELPISYDNTTKSWSVIYTPTEEDYNKRDNPSFVIFLTRNFSTLTQQNAITIKPKRESTGGCNFNLFG